MTDPDLDSSDINVNVSAGAGDNDGDAMISSAVRELCNRLRAGEKGFSTDSVPFRIMRKRSQAEVIEFLKALEVNTSVKHVRFKLEDFTKISAIAIVKYVESSKTLQKLDLSFDPCHHDWQKRSEIVDVVLRGLSRNTSVSHLIINTFIITFASVAFQELLTGTETLQQMEVFTSQRHHEYGYAFDEVEIAAITSGFANNRTLSDLKFDSWQEPDLTPVLTALQHHPALERIHFGTVYLKHLPSLCGLEFLLRSQVSKVKELVLDQVGARTDGVYPVMQAMVRNTKITNIAIHDSALSDEIAQQFKVVLRRNTTLRHLILRFNRLSNVGLAEIASGFYRNTSIETLEISHKGPGDIDSANVLRELIRRNKTITSLCLSHYDFCGDVATARSFVDGVRSNTTIQHLDLGRCGLGDQGISLLANALAGRNASIRELNLIINEITSMGVRALVDGNLKGVKTVTKLRLAFNYVKCEGAIILANALGRNAMPDLKRLDLESCSIRDDGSVALVSALEQNTTLQVLNLKSNYFGVRGFTALAESLPKIKGLQEMTFSGNAFYISTLPLLLEGFRKNTSLVKVAIDRCESGAWSRELNFLGHRNRFNPLLKTSDVPNASPQLGIWSHALAIVAAEPDVLFHVLRNRPKLVGYAGDSKKRKRDDE
jgi:Ran GTPase-activating protein (RanGAP) involved in mRNA processing and transport